MSISFLLHNNVLSVVLKGNVYQVSVDDPVFPAVKSAIASNDEAKLESFLSHKNTSSASVAEHRVKEAAKIGCKVVGETLYYNGEVIHNSLADKIKEYIRLGLPYNSLTSFMENLMLNTSRNSVEQLFNFLQHKNLPITEDGCFLAYKAVRSDMKDIYSGKIANEIGSVVSIPRNKVDDNPSNHCSHGLHCGALEYVKWYGKGDSKFIIVKVNPKDVVSVPSDHSFQKIRVCEYKVVDYFTKPLSSVYSGDSSENFVYEYELSDENFDYYDDFEDFDVFDPEDYEDDFVKNADFIYVNGVKYEKSQTVEQTVEKKVDNNTHPVKRDKFGRFCR